MGCLVAAAITIVLVVLVLVAPFLTTEEGPSNNWDTLASTEKVLEIDEISWIKINYVIPLPDGTYKVKYDLSTVTKWNKEERNQQLEDQGLAARY